MDISTEVAAFIVDAEALATDALPALFGIIGIFLVIKIVRRFTK